MNSTMRSNLTVGPPVEVMIYARDALNGGRRFTLAEDDPFAKNISQSWNSGLTQALDNLPRFPWEDEMVK